MRSLFTAALAALTLTSLQASAQAPARPLDMSPERPLDMSQAQIQEKVDWVNAIEAEDYEF